MPTSSDVCEECHGYSGGNSLCNSCKNDNGGWVESLMENQDLLNLCRLNLLEENIEDSVLPEREKEDTRKLLDFKRRNLAKQLISNRPKISDEMIQKHIKDNSKDGIYPWTEDEEICELREED